jgi:hypothetical protein
MDNNNNKSMDVNMSWDPNADLQIKGYEWEEISNFLQMFQGAMIAYNAVTARNISSGIIKVKYTRPDGSEVPMEEVAHLQVKRAEEYAANIKASHSKEQEK